MAVRFRSDRNKWYAQVTTDHGRFSKSFDTEREATEWEAEALAATAPKVKAHERSFPPTSEGSLGQLVRICEQIDWAGKDDSQMKNAHRLVRMLGPDTHIRELTMRRLDDLVADLRVAGPKGEPLSNTTILKYISAASIMLKRATRLGYIDQPPLLPEKRTLRTPEPRDLVISDEWFAALLDGMEKREQRLSIAITLFLRHMGCRVGEALNLTWDRVDLNRAWVQFVKTKGSMPRRLPASEEVLSILKAMKARKTQRVFPIRYWTYLTHYSDAKHDACDALGLGETVRKEWVIHTLRHTRITELASQGHQAPAIQQWAGHKCLAVTQRYIHGAGINLQPMVNC